MKNKRRSKKTVNEQKKNRQYRIAKKQPIEKPRYQQDYRDAYENTDRDS